MIHRPTAIAALFAVLFIQTAVAQVTESDSLALVAFYNATDGANWTDNSGWLTDPVGSWFGVTVEDGRVVGIDMNGNGLVGTLPNDISDLDALEFLRLYQDEGLAGPIPAGLGGIPDLWDLQLYRAGFTGPIPPELGNLSKLQRLYLLDNQLTGSIPLEILNIEPLRDLLISQNQLEGGIPTEIGNLVNLERLWVSNNPDITGPLPSEIGNLTKLSNLFIQSTSLEGPLPQSLTNLSASLYFRWSGTDLCEPTDPAFQTWIQGIMESTGTGVFCEGGPVQAVAEADSLALVALYDNTDGANWTNNSGWLAGPVIQWHGVTLAGDRVMEVDLVNNGLAGSLPPAIGDLDSLRTLNLQTNSLTGSIPAEIGQLQRLTKLYLNGNDLTGSIPPELGSAVGLVELFLGSNDLTGPIPAELGALGSLESLWIYSVSVSGELPSELGNLTSLKTLILEFTDLSGPLPLSLTNLTSLSRFSFNGTSLCIPMDATFQSWLDGIGNLTVSGFDCVSGDLATDSLALVAFYNALNGPNWVDNTGWLSDTLSNWTGVKVEGGRVSQLLLSSNGLRGTIPPEIGDLAALRIFSISNDSLEGPLPDELWDLTNLTYLALNNTELGGPFPTEVTGLSKLTTLSFDGNSLEGQLPESIGDMTTLLGLFLSRNNLTGPLPDAIGNLTELRRIEIAGNDFQGELPASLANVTKVSDLSLSGNQFSGAIPSFIGDLTSLRRVFLSSNAFEGELPESLGNLSELIVLTVGSNQGLTGPLPLSLTNLTNLTTLSFSSTGLCEPNDAGFSTWLSGIASVSSTGVTCTPTATEDEGDIPAEYRLVGNYPNPFNPTTTISYDLPQQSDVNLVVYDMLGREMRVLVHSRQGAGSYSVPFDAGDIPSGMLLYRLEAGSFTSTGTMLLVK